MALAPSRPLLSVPSRVIIAASILGLVFGLDARRSHRRYGPLTDPHRLVQRPCRPTGFCRRREARPLHARRSTRRTAPRRGPCCHPPKSRRPRPCRIAPAVEDLAGMNVDDRGHGVLSCVSVMISRIAEGPILKRAGPCNFRFRLPRNEGAAPGVGVGEGENWPWRDLIRSFPTDSKEE